MSKFNNPLDNIRVASPCNADWDEMFGDERKRHCGPCSKNVYNLSNLTRLEAENLLINSEGRLCVRFFRRADGTILTQDCPVGWQAVKKRLSRVATAVASMVAAIFTSVLAFDIKQRASMPNSTDVIIENVLVPLDTIDNAVVGEVDEGSFENGLPVLGQLAERSIQTREIKKSRRIQTKSARNQGGYYDMGGIWPTTIISGPCEDSFDVDSIAPTSLRPKKMKTERKLRK